MKKTFLILFLFIIILQTGGMLVFYRILLSVQKYEMQEVLKSENSKFEKIILSLEQYNNSKVDDNEISLFGEMFDVKSVEIIGSFVEIIAIRDTDEEFILNKIKILNTGTKHDKNNSLNKIQQLLSLIYILPKVSGIPCSTSLFNKIFSTIKLTYKVNFITPPAPPPKF